MAWHEEEHPRDSDGRFASTNAHKALKDAGYNSDTISDEWAAKLANDIGLNEIP